MSRKFFAPLIILMAICIVSLLAIVAHKDEQLLVARRKIDANSAVIAKESQLNQILRKQIEKFTSESNAMKREQDLERNELLNAHAQIDQINNKLIEANSDAVTLKRKLESCLDKAANKKGPVKKAEGK